MLTLIALAFGAGILTMLGPCSLPILPLVIGSASTGRLRRVGAIVVGFGSTFVLTTVVVVGLLQTAGVTTEPLRLLAGTAFAAAGLLLAWPRAARWLDRRSQWAAMPGSAALGRRRRGEVVTGLAFGAGIGLLWAPCVAPLMAGAIAAAAIDGPTPGAVVIATAYVIGAAVPLALIALGGRALALRLGTATRTLRIRQAYGVLMVVAGLTIVGGLDLRLQAALAAPASTGGSVDAVAAAPTADLQDLGPAPELRGITAWINSEPLTLASVRGKVVLIHFWTFACINCIHVQPYVKAWADRYAGDGLVVIGVHTPELSFERDLDNVRRAVTDDGVGFPVAFDPDYATWRAYANHAWPAFYFIGRDGRIRHTHVGEGDYAGSEAVIRALVAAS